MTEPRVAVILLNLGGPDSSEAIRPFLYNLFSDRDIIKLGPSFMQKPLAWLLAKRRAPKTKSYYDQIGGASPILSLTNDQGMLLKQRLRAEHGNYSVFVGMRYWNPFIDTALERAKADGAQRVIGLSMYPQYSIATSGSSEKVFNEAAKRHGFEDYCTVPAWYDHPYYIDALAGYIRMSIMEKTQGDKAAHILFSAHSLPQSIVDDGDPYVDHVMGTIKALEALLPNMKWSLGYQSKSGPVKWLEPSTESELERLAADGVKDVIVVPVSFVSDHVETLYEIDILYKEIAEGLGIKLRRIGALNSYPLFIRALEDLVINTVVERGWVKESR
jgi:ferrochelatase